MKYDKNTSTTLMKEFINDWASTLNYEQMVHLSILMANGHQFELSPSETATIILHVLCKRTKTLPGEHKECITDKLSERFKVIRQQYVNKHSEDDDNEPNLV